MKSRKYLSLMVLIGAMTINCLFMSCSKKSSSSSTSSGAAVNPINPINPNPTPTPTPTPQSVNVRNLGGHWKGTLSATGGTIEFDVTNGYLSNIVLSISMTTSMRPSSIKPQYTGYGIAISTKTATFYSHSNTTTISGKFSDEHVASGFYNEPSDALFSNLTFTANKTVSSPDYSDFPKFS